MVRKGQNVLRACLPVLGPVVSDHPERLARVAARDDRRVFVRRDDLVLVVDVCVGFVRRDETRTHPDPLGA